MTSFWNRWCGGGGESAAETRLDRQRILLDLLWQTPMDSAEAVAVMENYPAAVRQRDARE